MRAARLLPLAALAAITLAAGSAGAATLAQPTGLHAFLLRADEPPTTMFSRTPSFAWNPVPGATGYEFQLSTSNTFSNHSGDNVSDNSIFYDTNTLLSPVASPPLTLPWITGTPHALYARVRATTPDGVTPWSDDFGFDLEPDPLLPTPLTTEPGLLRWSPIEGADSYQVWLIDLPNGGKIVHTRTNVLDEREFYTFHQSPQWIGTIRWRVRAVRSTEAGGPHNGLPVTSFSAWSPIYKSTNPAATTGPLKLVNTISDVVEDGSNPHNEPAHKLMPAFTWSGNQLTANGITLSAELFRVEIFSDRECVNRVYASPIVGGPSFAPRPWGSMSLPDPSNIAAARSIYPSDGQQGPSLMYDGTGISSNEDAPPASPTSTAPSDAVPAGASQPVATQAPPATFGPAPGGAVTPGAPVDLWDTYWPDTGYYWTVVPVAPTTTVTGAVGAPGASKGSNLIPVSDASQYSVGETLSVGVAPNSDTVAVSGVGSGVLTIGGTLQFGHVAGEPIVPIGATATQYKDLVLPQDLCAPTSAGGFGLVQEFGLWSEPSLGAPQSPFVTGLSATGRLISATSSSQLYGQPLVAWTPALGAQKYEVEWSPSNKPFVAAGTIMTNSTSALLPLTSGTWYYRVRGFDYNLPTGSQQMAWSEPQSITIAAPTFRVVVGATKKAPRLKVVPTPAKKK